MIQYISLLVFNQSIYIATVLNMANSFALLGEATPALELLLHLITDASAERGSLPKKDAKSVSPLRTTMYGQGSMKGQISVDKEDLDLLWRLYHISTLAEDWATSLAAAEEILAVVESGTVSDDIPIVRAALIFALLQCHRPSLAMEKYVEWKDRDAKGALGALFGLFEADASISTSSANMEKSAKGNGSIEGVQTVSDQCEEAADIVDCELNEVESVDDDGDGDGDVVLAGELGVATDNNRGISLVLMGKTKEAFAAFEEASVDRSSSNSQDMSWLLLRPRFNLSLLLWREGHRSEAAKVWMGTRILGPQTTSCDGDSDYQTKDLRTLLQEAISRHGLYCAKEKASGEMQAGTGEHIMPWRSADDNNVCYTGEGGTHIVGLDMEQVLAFDVIVLQHAVAERSKRESREFNNTFSGISRS